MHHQKIHHNSRSVSYHDSPPRHSPPHDPHYAYHQPYTTSNATNYPCPQCSAPPTSFHMDSTAGDLICTQCGTVLDSHLRDPSAEWREFANTNEVDTSTNMRKARCGRDVLVDETKWVGGLMPTKMSSTVYAGSNGVARGTSDEKQRMAIVRGRLKRTHNMIENMIEQEQKERYRNVVLERKARDAQIDRGEIEEDNSSNDDGIEVNGDYEGLMRQRGEEFPSTRKRAAIGDQEEEEHAFISLKDKKWSLSDAIILYGTLEQVQQWSTSTPSTADEWTQSTLETERAQLIKKCDASRRTSLQKLHLTFTILEKAALKLDLNGPTNPTFRESISWLLKFVTKTDGIRIKGISSSGSSSLAGVNTTESALSLSLLGTGLQGLISTSSASSKKSKSSPLTMEIHRLKQYASLGAAILYLSAKRTGVGRTLTEVCSSFGTYQVVDTSNGANSPSSDGQQVAEVLVRPKYCSRAMQELRTALPEIVEPIRREGGLATTQDLAATLPSTSLPKVKLEEGADHEASVKEVTPNYGDQLPPSAAETSLPVPIKSECTSEVNSEEAALADLILRMAKSLNLPPCAISAATLVAIQCVRDINASSAVQAKPSVQSKPSSSHIRPRQRRRLSPTPLQSKDTLEVIAVSSILLICTAGGTMQRLAYQALSNDTAAQNASWSSWQNQPSWHRDISQLEQFSGVPRKTIISYYSNTFHPRRSYFLSVASKKSNELINNIVTAVPLMSLRNL